jgi:hypothetical protein
LPAGPLFAALLSADGDSIIQFMFPPERLPAHTQVRRCLQEPRPPSSCGGFAAEQGQLHGIVLCGIAHCQQMQPTSCIAAGHSSSTTAVLAGRYIAGSADRKAAADAGRSSGSMVVLAVWEKRKAMAFAAEHGNVFWQHTRYGLQGLIIIGSTHVPQAVQWQQVGIFRSLLCGAACCATVAAAALDKRSSCLCHLQAVVSKQSQQSRTLHRNCIAQRHQLRHERIARPPAQLCIVAYGCSNKTADVAPMPLLVLQLSECR